MIAPPGQPQDLGQLRGVIAEDIPWVAEPDRLRVIGFGFRSVAVETVDDEVLLIGKVAETAASYERIFRFAPHLSQRLTGNIPRPSWYLPTSERLPGGALCYPKLSGRPLEMADIEGSAREKIVVDLASFLRDFHGFPIEQAREFDVPIVNRAVWTWTVETVLPRLRSALAPEEYDAVDGWWRELRRDGDFWDAPRAFRHGDFWHENILVDPDTREVLGILDLEYAAISDPACDLATLQHLDSSFAGDVAAAYAAIAGDLGPNFERRIDHYWELREFDGLRFAIDYDDPAEFEDGLEALRAGPILGTL